MRNAEISALLQAVAIQRRVHEIMVTVLNTAGDVNTPLSQVTDDHMGFGLGCALMLAGLVPEPDRCSNI